MPSPHDGQWVAQAPLIWSSLMVVVSEVVELFFREEVVV